MIIIKIFRQQNEDPFYVFNLGQLLHRYDKWMANLSQVHPFYAVKCNDDPAVLKILASLGCGFDCASKVTKYTIIHV